jgi:hypothetical protein
MEMVRRKMRHAETGLKADLKKTSKQLQGSRENDHIYRKGDHS